MFVDPFHPPPPGQFCWVTCGILSTLLSSTIRSTPVPRLFQFFSPPGLFQKCGQRLAGGPCPPPHPAGERRALIPFSHCLEVVMYKYDGLLDRRALIAGKARWFFVPFWSAGGFQGLEARTVSPLFPARSGYRAPLGSVEWMIFIGSARTG